MLTLSGNQGGEVSSKFNFIATTIFESKASNSVQLEREAR